MAYGQVKMPGLLACLPTVYYLSTRYDRVHKRVVYVLKFWGSYVVLLLFVTDVSLVLQESLDLCLSFLIFCNLYDLFCYENDHCSTRWEENAVRRTWSSNLSAARFLTAKILLGLALNVFLFISAAQRAFFYACAVQVALVLVFAIHNRLRATIRPITFFFLYLLKGAVFGTLFLNEPSHEHFITYIAFVFVYSMSYMPKYMFRKVWKVPVDTVAQAGGIAKFIVRQPIFYKNLLLLSFACFYAPVLWILVYIDILTGIEWLADTIVQHYTR